MPLYNYRCSACGHSFEKTLSVLFRFNPTHEPCPNCHRQEETIALCVTAPRIVSGIGDNVVSKTDSRFRERLKEIKKNNPGSTIDV